MYRFLRAASVLALGIVATFATTPTYAVPITYTEQTTASGFLDGVPFSDATVTLTEKNDTNNVLGAPPSSIVKGTATVDVSGVGTDTFSGLMSVFAKFSGVPLCAFSELGITILGSVSADCVVTIDLKSNASVSSGVISEVLGGPIITLGGFLELTGTSTFSTFTATLDTTTAIPEPSSMSLCLVALCVSFFLIGLSQKRRTCWVFSS